MNLTIFQYAKSNPRAGLKLDNACYCCHWKFLWWTICSWWFL